MYVDSHQHFWRPSRGDYEWLTPSMGPLYRDFMPEDLLGQLARCGVGRTILVQAAATEAETRFLFEIASECAEVAGVVGWVDFGATDAPERIQGLAEDGRGRLKGLRPMIQDIADPLWVIGRELDGAFAAVIDHGLRFDALVTSKQMKPLAERLHRHPRLKAVLDHAGKPEIQGAHFDSWKADMARIAETTSAYCKLSGLLTQAQAPATVEHLDPFVEHIFECFGASRVMWGSDWPVVTTRASYEDWLAMSLALVGRHARGREEAVFCSNAARFYDLV